MTLPDTSPLPARPFSGIVRRIWRLDDDFDVFVLGFPLYDSDKRFVLTGATEAELVIRINSSEGRVSWPVPESIHRRAEQRRN